MTAEVYEEAAAILLEESGCTVLSWRNSNTGRAFTSRSDWGIEVPRPRGPITFGTFAHEVGHQMLHRENRHRPRWLEEVEAWEYALAQFDRFDLPGRERSQVDAAAALRYASRMTLRRCSHETAKQLAERYPRWVWGEGAVEVDLALAELKEESAGWA